MAFDGSSWPGRQRGPRPNGPADNLGRERARANAARHNAAQAAYDSANERARLQPPNPGKHMAKSFRGRMVVPKPPNLGWSPWKRQLLRRVPYLGAALTALELYDLLKPGQPAIGPLPNFIVPPGWTPGCNRAPLRNTGSGYGAPDRIEFLPVSPGIGCGTSVVTGTPLPASGADVVINPPGGSRGIAIAETFQPTGTPFRTWRSWGYPDPAVTPTQPFVYQPPRPASPPVVVSPQPYVDPWVMPRPGSPQPFPAPIPYRVLPDAPAFPDPYANPTVDPEPRPDFVPGVIVIPGTGPWPDIRVPIPMPNPVPKPGTPTPTPGPVPGVIVDPALGPTPLPPYASPAPTVRVDIPADAPPQVKTEDGTHTKTPPRRGEKEKKARVPRALLGVMKIVGTITEAGDLIDVVYNAIPCAAKFKAGMFGRPVTAVDKAQFIATHADQIDETELLRGYTKNQFEDAYYGRMSPERAYYQQSYKAGTGKLQGGKFHRYTRRSEQEQRELASRGYPTKDPVIEAFNSYVDSILGSVPDGFGCCRGKQITCGKPKRKR